MWPYIRHIAELSPGCHWNLDSSGTKIEPHKFDGRLIQHLSVSLRPMFIRWFEHEFTEAKAVYCVNIAEGDFPRQIVAESACQGRHKKRFSPPWICVRSSTFTDLRMTPPQCYTHVEYSFSKAFVCACLFCRLAFVNNFCRKTDINAISQHVWFQVRVLRLFLFMRICCSSADEPADVHLWTTEVETVAESNYRMRNCHPLNTATADRAYHFEQ